MHAEPAHAGHVPATTDTRALVISGLLTGVYFLVELAVGLLIGSIAVISDALHTFSAVGGVLLALVAGHIAQRGPTRFQTYGWVRAEIVGALFNGLFLAGMALVVFWIGVQRLRDPMGLATTPMLLVAAGGLVTEAVSFGLLYRRQRENLNVRGAFWHIIQTLVGSLIVIVAAVVIRFTDFLAIDPFLGMAFGVVLVWAAWRIVRDALQILLEWTPKDLDLNAVVAAMREVRGVDGVHHLHAWSLTQGRDVLSAHVKVRDAREADRILQELHGLLRGRFGIYFSTLQLEERCLEPEEPAELDALRGGLGPRSQAG